MSSPPSKRSNWEELPPEVFEQTLVYLDDESLLALAKTTRLFNRVALEKLFGQAMMNDLSKESRFSNIPDIGSGRAGPVTEGLRLALWIRSLEHVHYHLSHDLCLNNLRCLTAVIARVPVLRSLQLDLRRTCDISAQDIHLVAELCDTALARGCESLKLGHLKSFPCGPQQPPTISRSVTIGHPPSTQNLHSVHLSGAFLHDGSYLLQYTFGLLESHSNSIRRLHFDSTTLFVPGRIWDRIFCSISFPNLETLVFDHQVMSRVKASSLVEFLSRHSNITTLRLYCGLFRNRNPFEKLKQPILPRLLKFESESRVVSWFFENPSACANVQEIIINQGEANARHLDEALLTVGASGRAIPGKVILRIKLDSRFRSAWMTRHIEDSESRLREVQIASLAFRTESGLPSMDTETIDCLARWIALFPVLRHLEISRAPLDIESSDQLKKLHNAVLEYCPGLESFIFKFTSQEHDSMFL